MEISGSQKRRDRPTEDVYPFYVPAFARCLIEELPWLQRVTSSEEAVERAFAHAAEMMRTRGSSLDQGMEVACEFVLGICGAKTRDDQRRSVTQTFWRVAHALRNAIGHGAERIPLRAATATAAAIRGVDQTWRRTDRPRVSEFPDLNLQAQFVAMNNHILEALVEVQEENRHLFTTLDLNPIFVALALARDGRRDKHAPPMTAEQASHYATMAIRFEACERRLSSHALKGLRRWQKVNPRTTIELAVSCIWTHGDPEVRRHHQLWHYQRTLERRGIVGRATHDQINEGSFLLLVGVVTDNIFASLPPEHTADAVVSVLFGNADLSPRQKFDIRRLLGALRQPRSPYLHFVFPKAAAIGIETWARRLSIRL
jgi:hypothetical protein